MSMIKISLEQEVLLSQFSILRVNAENEAIIKNLSCSRNNKIERFLKSRGLNDNVEGRLAMYMILSPKKELCTVFTLSCGMLFTPEVMDADQSYVYNQYQNGKITADEAKNEIRGWDDSKWVINDTLSCTNPEAVYARVQYPALELVHICNNDCVSEFWKSLGLPNRMGETLFWCKIVPLIKEINDKVGFEYLYLYAADNKKLKIGNGGKLINHYERSFAFRQNEKIGIIKPQYNNKCTFMSQSIMDLFQNREVFLNTFNGGERRFFPHL